MSRNKKTNKINNWSVNTQLSLFDLPEPQINKTVSAAMAAETVTGGNVVNQTANLVHEHDEKNIILTEQKTTENGNRISTEGGQQQQKLHGEIGQRNGTENGTGILESTGTVRHTEEPLQRQIRGVESGEQIDTVPERNRGALSRTDENEPEQWLQSSGSERTSMGNFSGRSRAINYHNILPPKNFSTFNKRVNYEDNAKALDVVFLLEKEKRPATEDEQKHLAKYVGFGGLKEILLDPERPEQWKTQSDNDLKPCVQKIYDSFGKLDPDGSNGLLESAKRSIINAHFTSYDIINAVYDAIGKAGFIGGKILEPAAGIGNFIAAMPIDMAKRSSITAIEMDTTSGKILQNLFPTIETRLTGFEKLKLPENHFDLIVSNVPFGDIKLYDPQLEKNNDKKFQEASNNIHNYFFAKSILLAKPGAMLALVTSRFTLDSSQNQSVRELMADKCEFLGAVRLPDTAFKANAGTEVVSDLIFLRKFNEQEEKIQKHDFLNVIPKQFVDSENKSGLLAYNEYFHNNPTYMLGKVEFGGLYSGMDFNLKGTGENIYQSIKEVTDKIFDKPVIKINNHFLPAEEAKNEISNYIRFSELESIGNIVTLKNGFNGVITGETYIDPKLDSRALEAGINPANIRSGTITSYERDRLTSIGLGIDDFSMKVVEKIKVAIPDVPKIQYIEKLRKQTKQVIYAETNNESDLFIASARDALKETYQQFVGKFGNVTDKSNEKIIKQDSDCYLIFSLEKQDKVLNKISPSDILFQRTINPELQITHTEKIEDAITVSLQKYGRLEMKFISELMDKPYSEIMASQKGDLTFIFRDEFNNHFTRSEYLSGNVVEKLENTKAALDLDPSLQNNIEQLLKVQPKPIPAMDIYSPLHARWIPVEHIKTFLEDELKTKAVQLSYSPSNDQFSVSIPALNAHAEAYATKRKTPAWIIQHALNGVEPVVKYTVIDDNKNEKVLLDPVDTQLAKELYKKFRTAWDDFKFNDITRRQEIAGIYNRKFNNTVLRQYDGQHQLFPGLIGYVPMPHQKDAIFRNLQEVGGINDHMVGAGKTLIQIVTAMELRRLKTCNKPMIIGLKSQIPQLYAEFKKSYPLSKVLFPTDKDFSKENRPRLLNKIATNDWDCIILSHDQFNGIRQPLNIQVAMVEELKREIKDEIATTTDKLQSKSLEKRLYKYEQRLEQLKNYKKDENVLDFKQLGVDFLMVDESQEFKNLEFITKKKNIRGLGNPVGSKRAFNMLIACRHLQDIHKGDKGVIFSSGTTISNSMAELYLLFKYLCPSKMKEMGLTSFDKWAGNFANDYSDLEFYMGKFKEVHRFREFANLPELVTMYRSIADVRNNSNLVIDKPKATHKLIKIQPSDSQLAKIVKLQDFIESKGIQNAQELGLTAGFDAQRGINPSFAILAINYAKKLSLDPRLINPDFEPGTKLAEAASNIHSIYKSSEDYKGTQLVFSDLGTPKSKNQVDNLYSLLEESTPQADLNAIFGENYHDLKKKPTLDVVQQKISEVLVIPSSEVKMLTVEANTADKFDVYNELKRLLVERGIPEKEIVFIHDYNSRTQKEKLFDDVNLGLIRIVLGSSKKLGTGVNVQKRLIGLHHLDILWNPAPMEQRNGRGERQGNWAAKEFLFNTIPVFYYATERTLDASMYYVVAQKTNFIAQMKTSQNPEQRIIKDMEEDVDMGSMAAELSGDPIFKEKATLQKRVGELSQLSKSFSQKKFDIEESIRFSIKLEAGYRTEITNLEKSIPLLEKIPKDQNGEFVFSAKIGKTSFEKVGEFGVGIVAEADNALKYKPIGSEFVLGEAWGFKAIGMVKESYLGKMVLRNITSPLGDKITSWKEIPGGEMANGLQIKQAILEMPYALKNKYSLLETTLQNIETYKEQLNKVFPYQEELEKKTLRLGEVSKIILDKLSAEQLANNKLIEKNTGLSNDKPVSNNISTGVKIKRA